MGLKDPLHCFEKISKRREIIIIIIQIGITWPSVLYEAQAKMLFGKMLFEENALVQTAIVEINFSPCTQSIRFFH